MDNDQSFWQYKLQMWMRDITSLANPFILLMVPFAVLGMSKVFYTLLFTLAINELLGSIIKILFPKKRPTKQGYSNIVEKIDAGSFPSLHTSRIVITYLTLFNAVTLVLLKIIFILVIVLVAISRVYLKKHFLIDVLGGFILGLILFFASTLFY